MHMHASYNKSGYQHAVLFKNLFWLIKLYSSTPISFHNVASAQQILRPIRTKHYKYRLIISPPLGVQSNCDNRDARICRCLSVRSHTSKRYLQTSRNFLYMLSVAVARSPFDDNAICYVLPVLWMTSCFPVMGCMARG